MRRAQARWVLGLLHPERVPDLACDALSANLDSPSLRVLAGESQPTRSSIDPLFRSALSELGLRPLTGDEARWVLGTEWAMRIVAGECSPFDGAKSIWRECCDATARESRLDVFRSLASEIEDRRFAASSGPHRHEREIHECERKILEAARRVLRKSAD